jgi:hypothetical protein
MPLNEDTLAGMLKGNIEDCFGPADDEERLECFCLAIAKGIIDHIKANAVVTASGPDPQGGTQEVTGTIS